MKMVIIIIFVSFWPITDEPICFDGEKEVWILNIIGLLFYLNIKKFELILRIKEYYFILEQVWTNI